MGKPWGLLDSDSSVVEARGQKSRELMGCSFHFSLQLEEVIVQIWREKWSPYYLHLWEMYLSPTMVIMLALPRWRLKTVAHSFSFFFFNFFYIFFLSFSFSSSLSPHFLQENLWPILKFFLFPSPLFCYSSSHVFALCSWSQIISFNF